MKLILLFFLICQHCKANCQSESYEILKKSEEYYNSKTSGRIEISAINKNLLKNDTNYYTQLFMYSIDKRKVAKLFYRDKTGFSIYNNSTTYYIYTYNDTYYIGENSSDNHLKFLPHWDPISFFKKYFSATKLNQVKIEHNQKEGYYRLSFSNKKDWNSVLYISDNSFSLIRYNETYSHKKFGTQFKEYALEEKGISETADSILNELDRVTTSFIRTTDAKVKATLREHEKARKELIESSINRAELLQLLAGENPSNYKDQYILLDYFYQTCLPCIKAIPELNNLRKEFDTTFLMIVGIDPIAKDAGHMENFRLRYNVTYPLLDGEIAVKFKKISLPGLSVRYPTLVLIKPDGVIKYIMEEYSKNHFKILRSYLKNPSR